MTRVPFFLLFLLMASCFCSTRGQEDDSEPSFEELLKTLEKQFAGLVKLTSYKPMEILKLKEVLSDLGIINELRSLLEDRVICGACQALVRNLQRSSTTVEIVGTAICNVYFSLATLTINDFCRDIVRINKPILEYIIKESDILTPEYACSVLLQNENCYYSSPALTWRIDIPEGGPAADSQVTRKPETSASPIKILHLSDFHISFDYEIGAVSDCGYPLCCKKNLGSILKPRDAGAWGDYKCDIPPWLLGSTLNFINHTHTDIDLIYFTGDIIDHTVWKASKEDNSAAIQSTYDVLADSFPNISVLPALGNHESAPLNVFAPPNITDEKFSQAWLYTLNSNLLSRWIPEESLGTVNSQGYYSILVNYKLRVIVLNNNVCYIYNWWLLYDTYFLGEQLEFLKKELLEAESRDQYVHIISHVFPGTKECIEPWEVNYNSLVTRFAHIIKGQFFGHTHTDGLKVFYSKIDGSPNNVGYNGASLTPFQKYNPNYKIVNVDRDTFDILDIETYYFNLTEANLYPLRTPRWQLLYSMKEAYQFDALTPQNFDYLAQRIVSNNTLFEQYWRYYVRDGDASLALGCNQDCRNTLITEITRTESMT